MPGAVPGDDRGLLLGDGLFETVLAEQGRLIGFEAHVARLTRGCVVLGLPAPSLVDMRLAAEAAVSRAGLANDRAAVRLTWTAGSGGRGLDRPQDLTGRLLVAASPAPLTTTPLRLATATIPRNPASPAARLKTLSYLDNVLARREARATGADEALMLNTAGQLACAAAANLFWIHEDRLFTPALDCGALDGTVRAVVLGIAAEWGVETAEVRVDAAVLASADAVFLTNSLMGVRSVEAVDERAYGPHPLVERLAAAVNRFRR